MVPGGPGDSVVLLGRADFAHYDELNRNQIIIVSLRSCEMCPELDLYHCRLQSLQDSGLLSSVCTVEGSLQDLGHKLHGNLSGSELRASPQAPSRQS